MITQDFVHLKSFEVASDAFELLKALLVGHCALAAGFIGGNYTIFVSHYNQLLQSENYVTCRESLRLLGELLLERANFSTMMKYISDRENLKILMSLLRSKKNRIQIEAFHVFKVGLREKILIIAYLTFRCSLPIHGSPTKLSSFFSTIRINWLRISATSTTIKMMTNSRKRRPLSSTLCVVFQNPRSRQCDNLQTIYKLTGDCARRAF